MLVGVMINEAKCRRPGEIRTGRTTHDESLQSSETSRPWNPI